MPPPDISAAAILPYIADAIIDAAIDASFSAADAAFRRFRCHFLLRLLIDYAASAVALIFMMF